MPSPILEHGEYFVPAGMLRRYRSSECAVFHRTRDEFGELSNMAAGFPLQIGSMRALTVEALYQACRYPHLPQVQEAILSASSPMTAKMKAKSFKKETRSDWLQVRVPIMKWCLQAKLLQHKYAFGRVLLGTGQLMIVEFSQRDRFWGAVRIGTNELEGANVLGRILTELRERARKSGMSSIAPVPIPMFHLLGREIGTLHC